MSANAQQPYKAIVYVYLSGGADSFNMLVPLDGCEGGDMYAQYAQVRGDVALRQEQLLPIDAAGSLQVCRRFGMHSAMPSLQQMYSEGDALWVANAGPLIVPTSKAQFRAKAVPLPAQLFNHAIQERMAQSTDAATLARTDGVAGRMLDGLGAAGYRTSAFAINGGQATVVQPRLAGARPVQELRSWGVAQLSTKATPLLADIGSLNSHVSGAPMAETWASRLQDTLQSSAALAAKLAPVQLSQSFAANDGKNGLGGQLEQVAKLIKANAAAAASGSAAADGAVNNREAFYVQLGGFDMHSGLSMSLPKQLGFVDHAMKSFREEMQAQGMWEQVVVVQGSEFGRTLTSNGDGTDHAWGGNYFVAGGAVRGGRILGQFPADLTEAGPQSVGRGRLLPTAAWEHTWNAVAQVSSH